MHVICFQIFRMWCRPRRMHADLRAVFVSGDTARAGDADRPGLRAGRERMRLQT